MTTTPRLGMTELELDQALPEVVVNEKDRVLEQGAGYFIVKDKDLATPPGSPADGDAYIIAGSPTGAWTGRANQIAFYLSTAWSFITPIEGTRAEVQDEDIAYRYSGSVWAVPAIASGNFAVAADIWAGTSTTKSINPDALLDSAAPVALTSGTTVTPDFGAGFNFTLSLAHNATLADPSNIKAGQSGVIRIAQTGGGNTMAYGSKWKFPGGAPVLSTAAGTIDVLAYWCTSSSEILAVLTKAYTA